MHFLVEGWIEDCGIRNRHPSCCRSRTRKRMIDGRSKITSLKKQKSCSVPYEFKVCVLYGIVFRMTLTRVWLSAIHDTE